MVDDCIINCHLMLIYNSPLSAFRPKFFIMSNSQGLTFATPFDEPLWYSCDGSLYCDLLSWLASVDVLSNLLNYFLPFQPSSWNPDLTLLQCSYISLPGSRLDGSFTRIYMHRSKSSVSIYLFISRLPVNCLWSFFQEIIRNYLPICLKYSV